MKSAQTLLKRRLTTAIALPILLLLLLSIVSIVQITQLLSALQWLNHTDQVIAQSNQVQKLLLDMETGSRGYLLTRESSFLEPYVLGRTQIEAALNELKTLVNDNPTQVQRVNDLQQQQIDWTREVPQVLALPQGDVTQVRSVLLRRKQKMDAMRGLIADFIETEEYLRNNRVRIVQRTTRVVLFSSVGLAIVIGGILAYGSWRQLQKVAHTYTKMVTSLQQSLHDRDQAESALRSSEERFRLALLEAPLPIMLHTESGEVLQINRQWVEITGYTLEDTPTIAAWTQQVQPDHRGLIETSKKNSPQEGLLKGERVILTRSGEERNWQFFSSPVGTLDDGQQLIISTAFDITERRRIERQFQESYNLLQAFIDGTNDAIFLKDRRGCFRLVNARLAQIFGKPKDEILGQDDTAFLPAETAATIQEFDRIVMTTGHSQIFEERIRENGEIRTFLSTKDPYIDAQGNVAGIIGIARDITDRKQAEEQIQKSAQRLTALQEIDRAILQLESPAEIAQAALSRLLQVVESDQAAVLLFDLAQDEVKILAGEIGHDGAGTTGSIVNQVSLDLLHREAVCSIPDLSTSAEYIPLKERLLAAGYHSVVAGPLIVDSQMTGDLLLAKREPNAFSDEDIEIVREVANQLAIAIQQSQLRDQLQHYATELEQRVADRTAQLEATNQELEAFTYSVSHDLRAPLRTMQGFAQALLEDYGDQLDDVGKSYMSSIVEDSVQMSGLIADLLDYSRLSRTQINAYPVELNQAIADALKQLTVEVREKQASLTIAPSLPVVMAHRATLVQVVTNLLGNAIKFVQAGTQPQINIYTREEQRGPQPWVKLYVEDNGIGIAPEHQERIFRVFERLHGAETYPGTGIGLAIVRKGLERMGGEVGVESQLEQGSRFWIALPKAVLMPPETHDTTDSTFTD